MTNYQDWSGDRWVAQQKVFFIEKNYSAMYEQQ